MNEKGPRETETRTARGPTPSSPSQRPPGPASADGQEETTSMAVPVEVIRWGLVGFAVASVLGFGILFFLTQDFSGSIRGFRRFQPIWILPCLLFAAMDWFGGGVRLWCLTRPLEGRPSYWSCVKISGVTAGMASLTPSGMGGGPAQLYGLIRQGMSVGTGMATNFVSLLVNLIFLSSAGLVAWWLGAAESLEEVTLPVGQLSAGQLFEWTAGGFAGLVAVIVFFAINPRPARGILVRLFGGGRRVRKVLRWIRGLNKSLMVYARSGKLFLAAAVLAGALHFGGRFLLGWGVLRGFGIDAGFWNIVILHVMLQYFLIFMPTPGAAGVGEILTPALMRPFLPTSLLVAYTAVWRVFLTYLTVAVGGGLLLRWIGIDQASLSKDR